MGQHKKITSHDSPSKTHTYAKEGVYITTIRGDFDGFSFNNAGDKLKLISIDFGNNFNLGNTEGHFYGAINLESVSGTPKLTGVTNFKNVFRSASKFKGNVSHWNTENITDMSYMFSGASKFNENISTWNVSEVTNMERMFESPSEFNHDLTNWDVCKVTNYATFTSIGNTIFETGNKPKFGTACLTNITAPNTKTILIKDDVLSIDLTFTRNVKIEGTPKLRVHFKSPSKNTTYPILLNYVSGHNTKTLTFNYTIKDGDIAEIIETDQNSIVLDIPIFNKRPIH